MILNFFGPSGCGKDTQAELLAEKYNFERVSTGELLRSISGGNDPIQLYIKKEMDQGFMDDDFVYGLLKIYIRQTENENLIFSGVVRRVSQIALLDKILLSINKKIDYVINFVLSDKEAVKRMEGRFFCPKCNSNFHKTFNPPKVKWICDKCNTELKTREDDKKEAILKRLEAFHRENDMLIKTYKATKPVINIDASKSIEEIHKELVLKLNLK